MIKKRAWRYYCEYCGKSSGAGGHMSRHEKRCTANPNRRCGMCGRVGEIGVLVKALGRADEAGVKVLRVEARDCPACMLAAIRQSGIQQGGDEEGFFRIPFDYTREKNRYWTEHNGRDRL